MYSFCSKITSIDFSRNGNFTFEPKLSDDFIITQQWVVPLAIVVLRNINCLFTYLRLTSLLDVS